MKFIKDMLSSGSKVSSKRVVTFVAFLLMSIGFLIDLFTDLTVTENIFEAMEYIVIAGLGFTATEGFTKKGPNGETVVEGEIN